MAAILSGQDLTPQQKKLLIDLERAGQKSKKPAPSTKPKK
jgi:hypothetical protein